LPLKFSSTDSDYYEKLEVLLNSKRSQNLDVTDVVAQIIKDVRHDGDDALIALTKKFDGIDLVKVGFRVTPNEIKTAKKEVSAEELNALNVAAKRIESFHTAQKPKNLKYVDEQGVGLGLEFIRVCRSLCPGRYRFVS
jgi:histidinol dehydrogenase